MKQYWNVEQHINAMDIVAPIKPLFNHSKPAKILKNTKKIKSIKSIG